MRGAQNNHLTRCQCDRIIPADAGSTGSSRCRPAGGSDHPRGCGEHYGNSPEAEADHGSSPRMRGALIDHYEVYGQEGIIPADAGSTRICSS